MKQKAQRDHRPKNAALNALTWDYPVEGAIRQPVIEEVLKEINGWDVSDRQLVRDTAI